MNPLLAKEIRLLLPTYVTALLLAFVPLWLMPAGVAITLFAIGAVLLGLSPFGREFGMNTFGLIMAQPLERARIWRTKICLAAAGMSTLVIAWCVVCFFGHGFVGSPAEPGISTTFIIGFVSVRDFLAAVTIGVLAFAGGLWTTLLFRQISSALWICVLVPAVLQITVLALGGSEPLALGCLGLYSIGAFLWSRRYFFKMQESAWTGGEVSLVGWWAASRVSVRKFKPWRALFRKEFQLHQFNLLGIGLLFVAHFVVIFVRKVGDGNFSNITHAGLHVFGGLWLLVPFIVGSASIAEERKLGTMDAHLTLPLSRRRQFLGKLLVALLFGAVLPAILPWIPEILGLKIGAPADIGFVKELFRDPSVLLIWFLICFGLTLSGFYGSSLSRGTVQALAIGVVTAWALLAVFKGADVPEHFFRIRLWYGPVIYYILIPALIVMVPWLLWRNYASIFNPLIVWRRNLFAWLSVLVFSGAITSAIYHRVWEFFEASEPAHGPSLLARGDVNLSASRWLELTARFRDGKVWCDYLVYEPGHAHLAFGEGTGFFTGGKFIHLSGSRFLQDSNWVDAAAGMRDIVAIKSDGTLWVSDKPSPRLHQAQDLASQSEARMVQFGQERNWRRVIDEFQHSFLLLKGDGTLWYWGTNRWTEKDAWPGVRMLTPLQVGQDSDWARIARGPWNFYAWKKDGTAWNFTTGSDSSTNRAVLPRAQLVMDRYPVLDNAEWRAFADTAGFCRIGLRGDGTLWMWKTQTEDVKTSRIAAVASPKLIQLGKDRDWAMLASGWGGAPSALKSNGTIWRWPNPFQGYPRRLPDRTTPARLGSHSDWVAISSLYNSTVALAADGSLWLWWDREEFGFPQPMLSGPRRPMLIENIFAGK